VRRLPTGRLLGVAILVGWVTVVGFHVKREYFKSDAMRLAEGAAMLAAGSHFYTVLMDSVAIGFSSTRLDTMPDGFYFEDFIRLDIPAMGELQEAVVQTRINLSHTLSLRDFRFILNSEIGAFEASGEMTGDSTLTVRLGAGGQGRPSTVELPSGALLDAAVPLRMAAAGALREGNAVSAIVFDPSSMSTRELEIRVSAVDTMIVPDSARYDEATERWVAQVYDTVPVWRLEQSYGSVGVSTWVDNDGMVVRAESPLGFVIQRTAYELADQAFNASRASPMMAEGYGVLIERTAIAANADLSDVATAPRLAVRLLDVDLEGFDLAGGRQTLRGDTLLVTRESAAVLAEGGAGYTLPYTGGGAAAEELGATPLIQAEDPRIRAAALEAVDGTTDPALAARRLTDWVYEYIDKNITLSVPSALQVLEAAEGDCNEHTVLYVAMARSLGLPTRTAVGLVQIDGRFYYHAWPEVWLDGDWVAVDPTLGQVPADASHLRFLVGGLARQVELIRLIGRLGLEVV